MTEDKNQKQIQKHLDEIERHVLAVRGLLFKEKIVAGEGKELFVSPDQKVIEGIFNGEAMIDQEGETYPVSPNYASKSQLVVGDKLKLTIAPDGRYIYKQIGPVERQHLVAVLEKSGQQYFAITPKKRYRVLLASVTYFKVNEGEKVTIVVPKDDVPADWAAIEHRA